MLLKMSTTVTPTTPNWLWVGAPRAPKNVEGNNGNGETESHVSQGTSIFDVFQEREGGGGMRVGRDFQAKIPNMIPDQDRNVQAESEKALLVWKPTEKLTDKEIEDYISMAKSKYQYTGEQALGLLYWHRYDIQRATQDLGNFTPHPEEWTIEDRVLFDQAFQFHGKSFDKIRQMLPDKSMSSLIRYYYNSKKQKNKSSTVMDRQVKKLSQEDDDSFQGTNGTSIFLIQGHNQNNNIRSSLQHRLLPSSIHSESEEDIMILEHG